MRICHCALPAIRGNSDCCKYCSNNQDYTTNTFPKSYFDIVKFHEMTKKEVIEKFDETGRLIERITKEV